VAQITISLGEYNSFLNERKYLKEKLREKTKEIMRLENEIEELKGKHPSIFKRFLTFFKVKSLFNIK